MKAAIYKAVVLLAFLLVAPAEGGCRGKIEILEMLIGNSTAEQKLELAAAAAIIEAGWNSWLEDSAAVQGMSYMTIPLGEHSCLTVHPHVPEVCLFLQGHAGLVGRGATKKVYRAIAYRAEKEVAVAFPCASKRDVYDDEIAILEALRGCQGVQQLNFVSYESRSNEGYPPMPVIVSDYYSGGTAAEWLASGVPITVDECICASFDLFRAILAIQSAGIVHGDISLRNIMLSRDKVDGKVRGAHLIDFGLSRQLVVKEIGFNKDTAGVYAIAYDWFRRCSGTEEFQSGLWQLLHDRVPISGGLSFLLQLPTGRKSEVRCWDIKPLVMQG